MNNNEYEQLVIVGFGWVGQANALAFLQDGHKVSFFDIATQPTLHYQDAWASSYAQISRLANVRELDSPNTVYLVCVGDRFDEKIGKQNIEALTQALEELKGVKGTVILRSTVVPTALNTLPFDMYMPEFLHEKYAIEECGNPVFLVLGMRDQQQTLPALIARLEARAGKIFRGTPEEAAYVKYLSNLWNGVRIVFTNEFGDAMQQTGINLERVEKVLHTVLDSKAYQRYGKAFGGHCLPKDIKAFVAAHPETSTLLQAAWDSNEQHRIFEKKDSSLPEWFSKW